LSGWLWGTFDAPFMQRALLIVVVIGVVSGVVSTYVALRKVAFFADTLTHTVFPGVAIAFVADRSLWLGALVAGVVTAVAFAGVQRQRRLHPDAALAVILTTFFALGVIVVSRVESFTNDLVTLLFGQVLTVTGADIATTAVVGGVGVAVVALLHRELVGQAFDPLAMEAMGRKGAVLDLALDMAVTLVVVASIRAVGTTLVLAMLVTPAVTARVFARSMRATIAWSILTAVGSGVVGLVVSFQASVRHGVDLAPAATIVVVLTAAFALTAGAGGVVRRIERGRTPATVPQVGEVPA
jgi:manganese/iron transport system permease protein